MATVQDIKQSRYWAEASVDQSFSYSMKNNKHPPSSCTVDGKMLY